MEIKKFPEIMNKPNVPDEHRDWFRRNKKGIIVAYGIRDNGNYIGMLSFVKAIGRDGLVETTAFAVADDTVFEEYGAVRTLQTIVNMARQVPSISCVKLAPSEKFTRREAIRLGFMPKAGTSNLVREI